MAAMFQMQSANWEETQEKMSQLVSRFADFLIYYSSFRLMDIYFCSNLVSVLAIFIVPHVSILTHGVPDSLVGASRLPTATISTTTNLYRPAMYATAVGRKVRYSLYVFRTYIETL